MAQGPIKVSASTKERVRYAAALASLSQSELVERAVAEYVERHAGELYAGLEHAREALSNGLNASVAYALGVSEEDINRIAENRTVSSSQSGLTARPAKSRRVGSTR
jgi:hypothetical protein